MKPDFTEFLNFWGQAFVAELKRRLNSNYDYAPGINGDAYSNGRNKKYSGSGIKSAESSSLYKSIEGKMTTDGFELLMLDYWYYVNYGRKEGSYVPISPLVEWATTKGFDNPVGAAWGANYNIYKFGIAPTNFYDDAITTLEGQFDRQADNMMEKTINDFFDNLLEKNITK